MVTTVSGHGWRSANWEARARWNVAHRLKKREQVAEVIGAPVYDFGMVAGTAPGAGEVLGKVVIPRPLLIPPDLAGSAVHVDTPPEADFAIALTRNAVAVASITVHADASTTLATAGNAPVDIAAGDVIRFAAPATPVASIAGISITIAARRLA